MDVRVVGDIQIRELSVANLLYHVLVRVFFIVIFFTATNYSSSEISERLVRSVASHHRSYPV